MDFLNRALAQLSDLFRSMTPGARLASALLLGVAVISLGFLFNTQVAGTDAYLMGGERFAASELPAMEAAFAKAGLAAYEVEGNRVRVPRGQQSAYMGALADAGALPSNFGDLLMRAVGESNPFHTSSQREELLKVAKQKELANIVRAMSGIENAAVFFDEKPKPGLRRDKLLSASVIVKPQGSMPLDDNRVPMIRHLVAGAVAGLTPQKVTVIDQNGRTYAADESGSAGSGQDDVYFATQQRWQNWYRDEIRNALSYVENAVVTVNVELDKELEHTEESVKVDPQPVAVHSTELTKILTQEKGGGPAGQVGLQAQQPNAGAALSAAAQGNRTSEDTSNREEQNVVSHNRKHLKMKGLTPTRVSVAVAIPDTYIKDVWRTQNVPAAGQPAAEPGPQELAKLEEEIKVKIRQHVFGQVLAPGEVQDPSRLVTVTTFAHLPRAPLPMPASTDAVLAWLAQYWSTLGLFGLAGFGLLVLRSTVRAGTAQPTSLGGERDEPVAGTIGQGEAEAESDAPLKKKRRISGGPSLRDELAELVRDDPDTAANILRGWIGNTN